MPLNIIAEIGASHGKDLDAAKALCLGARYAGADWIKLQTYTPETISHKGAGVCPSGPWQGKPLYELYEAAHMPREMQAALIDWLASTNTPWFSTPFSVEDVAWLEERKCPMYKLSSFDRANGPLIKALDATRKRLISSDGMGQHTGHISLRCVSEYPASPLDYGLAAIGSDSDWASEWGISDHTPSSILGAVAIGKGATWIEKHIKLNGDTVTADSGFALDCDEFHKQCRTWRAAYDIATSTQRPVPALKAIMPHPVEVDGKTVWRRG